MNINIDVDRDLLIRVIELLHENAHDTAAHSQGDNLMDDEETEAHSCAVALEHCLINAGGRGHK